MRLNKSTLRWFLKQVGLSDGRIFDPAFHGRMADVQRPRKRDDGRMRIHIFSADFADETAARLFCYGTGDADIPEPITRELDGATINTRFVEVVFGDAQPRLTEFMSADNVRNVLEDQQSRNTLVIMTDEAFCDLPFQVHDTKTLRYLGAQIVAI